jgi:hypothetical protein
MWWVGQFYLIGFLTFSLYLAWCWSNTRPGGDLPPGSAIRAAILASGVAYVVIGFKLLLG